MTAVLPTHTPAVQARPRYGDWRVVAVFIVIGLSFAAAIIFPNYVPYSLMWAIVIATAAFASPIGTASVAVLGLVLSIVGGFIADTAQTPVFWIRMVAFSAIGVVGVLLAIQRSRREALLIDRATTDSLTGLANRRLLIERLEAQMEMRNRESGSAVLYADLDSFKAVNDTYGHAAGDEVLVRASERLRSCTRAADTVARFGGDEFVIACPSVTGPEELTALCERIIHAFALGFHAGQIEVPIGITLGVAYAPLDSTAGPTALIDAADLALTECKAGSPGTFKIIQT